jgi:hypothetical protein
MHTVYIMKTGDGEVAYVGCSLHVPQRFFEHSQKPWWPSVCTAEFEHFETVKAALVRESELIESLTPVGNDKKNPAATRLRRPHPLVTRGSAIVDLLAARGWQFKDLAREARLSRPYVSQIISGQRPGTPRALVAIAEALDVGIDQVAEKVQE